MDSGATSPAMKNPAPVTTSSSPPSSTAETILTPEKTTRPPPVAVDGGGGLVVVGDSSDDNLASVAGASEDLVPAEKKARSAAKLPDKYEILCVFFDCLVRSVRLFQFKGYIPIFSRICKPIEYFTDRRFTYAHLAKMKTIIPESLWFRKVLVHDEATCDMKPELRIVLQPWSISDVEAYKGESMFLCMRRVFRERVEQFHHDHPQGEDIAEEELPHPFTQFKEGIPPKTSDVSPCTLPSVVPIPPKTSDVSPCALPSVVPIVRQEAFGFHSSLSSSTSRPSFCRKFVLKDSEKTQLACLEELSNQSRHPVTTSTPSHAAGVASKQPIKKSVFLIDPDNVGPSMIPEAGIGCSSSESHSIHGGTPKKSIFSPARLMTTTTDVKEAGSGQSHSIDGCTPEKSIPSPARLMTSTPDVKEAGSGQSDLGWGKSLSTKRRPRRASLFGTSFLQPPLLPSVTVNEIKGFTDNEVGDTLCLADMFNLIHQIFQSGDWRAMTKNELVCKILTGQCKLTQRSEVEEQLERLWELIPEWICEGKTLSGDLQYSVNKGCCARRMRKRLAGAQ